MATKKPNKTPTKAQIKAKVIAIDKARTDALSSLEKEIERLYSSYFSRVKSLIASDKALRKTDALTIQNATQMMRDLEGIARDAGLGDVVEKFGKKFPGLAEVAAGYYEAFGLGSSLAGVSKETLAAWVDFSSTELTKLFDAELIAPVRSALLQVNFGNMTRDTLIDQITTLEPTLSTNSAIVAVDDAFSQFQRAVVVAKGEDVGLEIYQYIGPDDDITSEQCQEMLHVDDHGAYGFLYKDEIGPWLHPNLERYGRNPLIGGGHPRCFLPGTKIHGKIFRASKSFYSGESVTINTRKGHRLSVTPNHPILTARGFVPAALLNPGDKVVSYNRDIKTSVPAALTGESNEYERPALIEDVFNAISAKGFLFRCRPSPLDLHGDAQPWNGDIDIVEMDRVLPLDNDPVLLKGHREDVFVGKDPAGELPVGEGTFNLGVNRLGMTSTGFPSVPKLTLNQGGVGLDSTPFQFLTFGLGSFFDPAFTECTLNGALSDSVLALQLHDRFPAEILFDEVIDIRRHPYSGHVYNLESNTGWLIADGVCTSNCRHQWSPVTLSYAMEQGFEPRETDTGEE